MKPKLQEQLDLFPETLTPFHLDVCRRRQALLRQLDKMRIQRALMRQNQLELEKLLCKR